MYLSPITKETNPAKRFNLKNLMSALWNLGHKYICLVRSECKVQERCWAGTSLCLSVEPVWAPGGKEVWKHGEKKQESLMIKNKETTPNGLCSINLEKQALEQERKISPGVENNLMHQRTEKTKQNNLAGGWWEPQFHEMRHMSWAGGLCA